MQYVLLVYLSFILLKSIILLFLSIFADFCPVENCL